MTSISKIYFKIVDLHFVKSELFSLSKTQLQVSEIQINFCVC